MHIRREQPWQAVDQVRVGFLVFPFPSLTTKCHHRKSEAMQRSLVKMEKTLDVVLRSLGNPALQNLADTLQHQQSSSRSPSPENSSPNLANTTHSLMSPSPVAPTPDPHNRSDSAASGVHHSTRPVPPGSSSLSSRSLQQQPNSPKLDSLPDSTLNPLGLLADTSLAHRREKESHGEAPTEAEHIRTMLPTGQFVEEEDPSKVGLANASYFKPGRTLHRGLYDPKTV